MVSHQLIPGSGVVGSDVSAGVGAGGAGMELAVDAGEGKEDGTMPK